MFSTRKLGLCFLLLTIAPLMSQELRKVKCRFLSLDPSSQPPPMVNLGEEGAEVAIVVNSDYPSQPIGCFANGNQLSFLRADDKKPAALVTLPGAGSAFILLFIQGPKKEGALPWQVLVIEDSPKNFPEGGAYVVNFYKRDIRFTIGEHRVRLKPAGSSGVTKPKKLDSFNMGEVKFEFQVEEKWALADQTMLRFLPNVRYLMFAYIDPVTRRPAVRTCVDTK